MNDYNDFLKSKIKIAEKQGFDFDVSTINPALKPHNKLMVKWLVEGGKRACFASFGLHKTVTQLEAIRCILLHTGGKGLIICPLSVRQEFQKDAVKRLGWDKPPKFIRTIEQAEGDGIYITNYESVRDGKLDPAHFTAVSLDEASVLRGLGGSKTFREFMRLFTGDAGPKGDRRGVERVPYRFVATATPSPNDYIELLAYADFLGIMDVSQAKTRFFKRDSTKNDNLTLHPHKEEEFWLWVASWALFVSQPSDITGNPEDDKGYDLPPLEVHWHEIPTDHSNAGHDKSGRVRLIKDISFSLSDAAKEKKDSLPGRIEKMLEIRALHPDKHRIIWHDLEAERHALDKAIPGIVSLFGKQDLEQREKDILAFSDGKFKELSAKPVIAGSGCNFQEHCHQAIYLGIGFKFNDFIQSVHRLQRFLQKHPVRIDLIYTQSESNIRKALERKWTQHNIMVKKMTEIIKKYGLSHAAMASALTRSMGVERIEVKGELYTAVNNDNVPELKSMESNSVGLIHTSLPFTNQYEYSPNFADYGHSESTEEFFKQMDYSTPEAFRVLMPGRIAAIHVKDRIVPGGLTDLGFQTVYPFHSDVITHFTKHGFAFIGMKTIVTDVVRENKQTNRLGWSEQCKDGSRMGVGMSEYLLLFRKPQTDSTRGYADIPVVKEKGNYSRSRWQVDAHGFTRSSGNRCLVPEDLTFLDHDVIFKEFKDFSLNNIYDFEHHVKIGETLDLHGKLPSSFMLLQPQSWSDDVWTDVTRMLTLNGSQWSHGKEMHICPLQFDIVDRTITQFSNEGDLVLDYFAGLFTVPYRAVLLKRRGYGIELSPAYFLDGVQYCKGAEMKVEMPSLFDLLDGV
jgi:DNA modification methylase